MGRRVCSCEFESFWSLKMGVGFGVLCVCFFLLVIWKSWVVGGCWE